MPELLDWQRTANPEAVARYAADVLGAGRLVVFPTDTGYAVGADARHPAAVERARSCASGALEVALRGPASARDWAPGLGEVGLRLARRFWPGPLALEPADGVAHGLAGRLPEPVRRLVCPEGPVRLRAPGHEAVLTTLRHLDGPLVLAPVEGLAGAPDLFIHDGPARPGPSTVVRVQGGAWRIVQPGTVSEEQVRRQATCLVVFVCTGNTCRSPMAEALFKKRLADRLGCTVADLLGRGYQVVSAGVAADSGGPAAGEAVVTARRYGADLSGHASRALSPELAAQADQLVAMTHGHLRALLDHYPRLGARPRLLRPGADVADPVGQSQEVYDACADEMWRYLDELAAEVCR
jgi:protein-tyrosine phosphatase